VKKNGKKTTAPKSKSKPLSKKKTPKLLTAHKLIEFLQEIESRGTNLKKVTINFRVNKDSDVEEVKFIEEDLFDEETNSIIESVVLLVDDDEEAGIGEKEDLPTTSSEADKAFLELIKAEDLADEFVNNGDDDNADKLRKIIRNVENFLVKHMTTI
jgi:hypothetical protein